MILEKYSGSGNDFLITHMCHYQNPNEIAKKLCDRHLGIGADGFIILRPHQKYAYEWLFFNSDGSSALMCGNASRCVGLYAFKHQLAASTHTFWAGKRAINIEVKDNNIVKTYLGKPSVIQTHYLQTSFNTTAYSVDTGVPHLVIFVPSQTMLPKFKTQELKELREKFDSNINIVYIKDLQTLFVATYERGVEDITLACGTGMAASSVVHQLIHKAPKQLTCIPPSQEILNFTLQDDGITFEGKVRYIATCIPSNL
ncbi:diaminopimelate epimerase [Helicobacter anatolicus]|uniref:diaminopimelate epimerase n=1 Tax=Helicobacter anatolicus TaxID=2905874 RepID=UPI001E4D9C38|nr:diaminopimelate epimerase [Helicobacter anatolicus]MCE3038972.1 diaminopimelate epimerase [Helicobacter anatolicus]